MKTGLLLAATLMGISGAFDQAASITPVAANGRLQVIATHLCNQNGTPIQLRGMSTHGIQWFGWGSCIQESSLDALASSWGADILRISMYVQEGGYQDDPVGFREMVDRIAEEVTARGMYALLDFHQLNPGDPWYNVERAKEFFGYMSKKHADKSNVLYEICNEPSDVDWATIKSYAETIIPIIRANDPDGPIIVGTCDWSSFGLSRGGSPQEVIDNPIRADLAKNVLYTFHFYAASHGEWFLQEVRAAADELPIFVTEWGTQDAAGEGPNDLDMSQAYLDMLAEKKISWCNWNFSDDWRSGAVFNAGTCPDGPWTGESLKESGKWVMERLQNPPDSWAGGNAAVRPAGRTVQPQGELCRVVAMPSSGAVSFRFSRPGTENRVTILDCTGAQVSRLQANGGDRIVWDGRGPAGSKAPASLYLCEITTAAGVQRSAITLMR